MIYLSQDEKSKIRLSYQGDILQIEFFTRRTPGEEFTSNPISTIRTRGQESGEIIAYTRLNE